MYFIFKGVLEIIVNGKPVGALGDGAFFGEVALLDKLPRTATIRALSNTILYRLGLEDFLPILEDVSRSRTFNPWANSFVG
jgi:CRP-like cAMP-binding protein